jgi:SPP1 gp7 family putative phage head morphogenesis protein
MPAIEFAAQRTAGHVVKAQRKLNVISRREIPGIDKVMDGFIVENVDLIRTLAGNEIERVKKLVDEAERVGMRVEEIAKQVRRAFDVTESYAMLLARDQVLKLNSEITQVRQMDAGISEYVWSTSHDERVRESHMQLDGKPFSWLSPPVVSGPKDKDTRREHPGGDYQCRCVALPVIPGEE